MKITMYELIRLMKDGKAPKKIKFRKETYNYLDYTNTYDLFNEYNWQCCLNDEIEILPEENDEWEDIEELQEEGIFKFYAEDTGIEKDAAEVLDTYFEVLIIKINQLIKNQKYLKEKLENKNEKD